MTTEHTGWRVWPAVAVALAVLDASLTFENVWPTLKVHWGGALSVELALCVLLLAVAYRWAARLARRALPAMWVALVAGHYLDVTAPGLYGREFNLYWDSQHLGNVAAMLVHDAPLWLIVTVAGAAVLAVAMAYLLARLAIGQVATAIQRGGPRLVLGSLAATIILLFAAGQPLRDRLPIGVAFADPVTPAYARQARFVLGMFGPGAVAPPLGPSPSLDVDLRGLEGADVLLVFLESYGAVAYESPEISAALAPAVPISRRRSTKRDAESCRRTWSLRRSGILVARASEPALGRRGARPVHVHVADGVAARDDGHELRATRLPDGGADAGHAAGVARRGLLWLRPNLRPRSAAVSGSAVRLVGHP